MHLKTMFWWSNVQDVQNTYVIEERQTCTVSLKVTSVNLLLKALKSLKKADINCHAKISDWDSQGIGYKTGRMHWSLGCEEASEFHLALTIWESVWFLHWEAIQAFAHMNERLTVCFWTELGKAHIFWKNFAALVVPSIAYILHLCT